MDSGALIENWTAVCNKVKTYEGIDGSQINAFFSRLEPQAMSEGFLMLTADNDFIKTWIERHYVEVIKHALEDMYGLPFAVIIEVDMTPRAAMPAAQVAPVSQAGQYAAAQIPAGAQDPSQFRQPYEAAPANPYYQQGSPSGASTPQATMPQANPQQGMPYQQDPYPQAPAQDAQTWTQRESDGWPSARYAPAQQITAQSDFNGGSPGQLQDSAPHANAGSSGFDFGGSPLPGSPAAPDPSTGASQTNQPRAFENGAEGNSGFEHPYSMSDPSFDHYIDRSAAKAEPSAKSPQSTSAAGAGDHPTSTLTFENFVIGDSNRMAYSMAVDVAEMPGKTPLNPLFIYGKSGLGKTHLMRAIQNYICETQPHLKTVYVDSAELLSDYMEASAAHDKEKSSYKNFKTHYEEADVLLIDDIQYLQGKKQTLDIVFQIFNKLTSQGKQIVLSADRAPKNIDIDERYHSRFNQGGTIDIQPPEIETKLGIVKSFINEYRSTEGGEHFVIPEDIQMYIAENSSSNIRELKSAVTKVIYQMTFFNQPDLTFSDVRTLLENHFSGGTSRNLTVEDIQKEVETFFKVKHSDLIGPKRARNIVYPRQIAIYLCRQLLDLPFNDIGKKFNRDHSTAMHSVATVEEMMRGSREVQEEIETLKQIIREL